jgi:cyclophilin family peptidyl-prolyl cis-trans isomerase
MSAIRPRHASGLILVLGLSACGGLGASPTPRLACPTAAPTESQANGILAGTSTALVTTNKGTFTIQLYGKEAPIAAANFVALARCAFYEGITFHRVIAGFVTQAGDPQTKQNRGVFNGLGSGGPGYQFAIEPPAEGLGYDKYVVAMANALQRDASGKVISGEDSNGSQFFIDLADLNGPLPRDYTIFGKVVDGTAVVDTIGQVPTNGTPPNAPQNVPLDPVIIQSIAIQPSPSPSPG